MFKPAFVRVLLIALCLSVFGGPRARAAGV